MMPLMMPLTWALLVFAVSCAGTYAALARRARRGQFQQRLSQAMRPPIPREVKADTSPVPPSNKHTWEPLLRRAGQGARRRRFDDQLPDALTLLVSALRSGYSLARAAQLVAEEMPPPISEEFATALAELALGLPLGSALARMAQRVGSRDMELIVTAVTTQQQIGGNLAEILSRITGTIRERVRVQAEIGALTAEGKLSGLILVLMPPTLAVLLTLRSPRYFQPLLDSPLGHVLIGGAVLGQVIGGLIIRRMVTLDL